jgi:hypothetical protein
MTRPSEVPPEEFFAQLKGQVHTMTSIGVYGPRSLLRDSASACLLDLVMTAHPRCMVAITCEVRWCRHRDHRPANPMEGLAWVRAHMRRHWWSLDPAWRIGCVDHTVRAEAS